MFRVSLILSEREFFLTHLESFEHRTKAVTKADIISSMQPLAVLDSV